MSTVPGVAKTLTMFRTPRIERARSFFTLPPAISSLARPEQLSRGISTNLHFSYGLGGEVIPSFNRPGEYMRILLPSGAMSFMTEHCGKETYQMYQQWRQEFGIRDMQAMEVIHSRGAVYNKLNSLGIEVIDRMGIGRPGQEGTVRNGEAWRIAEEVLSVLPDKLLGNGQLKKIVFGSARVGAAAASAYNDNTVFIYAGAMTGSRRELIAKIIHEVGHSTEDALPSDKVSELKRAHQRLAGQFIGLDIMGGAEYRKDYQKYFSEFMAEMHLIYICAGPQLRGKINSTPEGKAWEKVYQIFRDDIFDGREYE